MFTRRSFLKLLGVGTGAAAIPSIALPKAPPATPRGLAWKKETCYGTANPTESREYIAVVADPDAAMISLLTGLLGRINQGPAFFRTHQDQYVAFPGRSVMVTDIHSSLLTLNSIQEQHRQSQYFLITLTHRPTGFPKVLAGSSFYDIYGEADFGLLGHVTTIRSN
jgi:hypothetical protein